MGIRVVLLWIQIGFVIEQAIEDVRGITLGTLNWDAVEGGIVIANKGIEFETKITEPMTVGTPEYPPRKQKTLSVATCA
jgi:hypothetical protein